MRSATIAFKAPIGEMAFELAADGAFTLKGGGTSCRYPTAT